MNSNIKSILVIDGNSWMHRAFHAIAAPLTAPDGRPTAAVFGFLSILTKTINEVKPDGVIAAFDAGVPAFRTDALDQYKIQRPPTDPLLKQQFPIIEELLNAMNVPVVKLADWEGDDILGTLARLGEEKGFRMFLATGDRDAFQLVTEKVSVVSHGRSDAPLSIITPEKVEERYGVAPEQVIDYLGLKGDPSDNIPGVAGIGEKTASKLLNEYGSLDAVIAAAENGEVKGKVGTSLVECHDKALASRIVATIERDVPLEVDFAASEFGIWDKEKVAAAFMELGMKAPYIKLMAFDKKSGSQGSPADAPFAARTAQEIQEAFKDVLAKSHFIGLATRVDNATLFDDGLSAALSTGATRYESDAARTMIIEALESKSIVALDCKELIERVYPSDSSLETRLAIDKVDPARLFDISLAAYLLDSGRTNFSLSALVEYYLQSEYKLPEAEEERVASDATVIAVLGAVLAQELKKSEDEQLMREIEMPLAVVLSKIERTGIALDVEFLAEMGKECRSEIDDLKAQILIEAGTDFNVDSPKQLGQILFEELKLPPGKKTKSGYSTDASVLEGLVDIHPIASLLLRYRELTKLQSTYIEALPKLLGGDGRLHTDFRQTVAATGRLASANPNLQNIPVRTDLGRRIREAFIPSSPENCLMSVDYSQIELRILAHLSGDEGLIEAFNSGEDFHAATAARIFGLDPGTVDPGMRSRAKAVNFGIIYGQGAHALSLSLGLPFNEGKEIIDRYYQAYPRVKTFLDETIEEAKLTGVAKTAFGRVRRIPELASSVYNVRAFGERTAMNHPMQGTAADLIKLAMIAVDKTLAEDNYKARMLLQVHDELVFEVPTAEVDRLSKMVSHAMESVAKFSVPLSVTVSIGPNWAAAK